MSELEIGGTAMSVVLDHDSVQKLKKEMVNWSNDIKTWELASKLSSTTLRKLIAGNSNRYEVTTLFIVAQTMGESGAKFVSDLYGQGIPAAVEIHGRSCARKHFQRHAEEAQQAADCLQPTATVQETLPEATGVLSVQDLMQYLQVLTDEELATETTRRGWRVVRP